ncbi:hypothetical protein J2T56_000203 [Natronobacillus azotifigens]|uniref:DUF2220 family protein n=1 Tax=Natronobacillus azotifigens TaxID=472978 RepID=A0A9J6R8I5_9BACI|nr:DUF2220 family protein [Natronobacillus azotifigens]
MERIYRLLATYRKKTITLSELEQLMKVYFHTYQEFSQAIVELEEEKILRMVKAKGRTARTPSLAFHYRINKSLLAKDFHIELQNYRTTLHPAITIDTYYGKDPSLWKADLPYLLKLDYYLKHYPFPTEQAPAPERSYELVGDEKWIVEKGGKELLDRVGLFEKLQIIPVSEPLMFALNPTKIAEQNQYHLIVENKTTYQGLLPVLLETIFSTLIYGSGKSVIKSIEQFPSQYPVMANHHYFYFGDIDREGISIWYSLAKKQLLQLALPFYQACLTREPTIGKEYQQERTEAVMAFLSVFSNEHQKQIRKVINEGKYYPQETLKAKELQQIWRDTDWTS